MYYYKNGAIVVETELFKNVNYQVSNQKISATFDGSGVTTAYALAYEKKYETECYCTFYINGKALEGCKKKNCFNDR